MNLKNLYSERLILMPITLEISKSLLNKSNEEVNKLGIKSNEAWPTEDTMSILKVIVRTLEKDKLPSGFELWLIIRRDNMQVIGDIGFHGKPDEKGEVEVGYGLVKDQQDKGFGFEALSTIMKWANLNNEVKNVIADCLLDNKASARILQKAGFKEINRDEKLIYWSCK